MWKMYQDGDLLTAKEASAILNRTRTTIYRWVKNGWLKVIIYPSGGICIPYTEVKRYLLTEQTS
jgi:excisionase family DNA binding protein